MLKILQHLLKLSVLYYKTKNHLLSGLRLSIKMSIVSFSEGESHDRAVLPVSDFQTKVPLYGRDHKLKAQAMRQAKDRKNQVARVGQTSIQEPLRLDKVEPEFVSAENRILRRYGF